MFQCYRTSHKQGNAGNIGAQHHKQGNIGAQHHKQGNIGAQHHKQGNVGNIGAQHHYQGNYMIISFIKTEVNYNL